jgi:hypothetical protein
LHPSREVGAAVEQIEQTTRQGHVAEAKNQIDKMLRQLRSGAHSASGGKNDSQRPGSDQNLEKKQPRRGVLRLAPSPRRRRPAVKFSSYVLLASKV